MTVHIDLNKVPSILKKAVVLFFREQVLWVVILVVFTHRKKENRQLQANRRRNKCWADQSLQTQILLFHTLLGVSTTYKFDKIVNFLI
mmetsp:Transcript_193/g.397  ORF Transcript_193/g.397 Transcript_193/m.397 type:complete len:88 (+) Transcript_193:1296-1559(+)